LDPEGHPGICGPLRGAYGGGPVSATVFAVQIADTDSWDAICCDLRCAGVFEYGGGMHTLVEYADRDRAEAAASAHRRRLATMPDLGRAQQLPTECVTCGQSKAAIRELQELVRRLEQQLAAGQVDGGEQP
jgi:hypothetical protein